MMRPACAYPAPLLQPGLQNGPDMYAPDRDSFGFGIGGQGSGCVPTLSSSSCSSPAAGAGNLYPTGPNGGCAGQPNMQPHTSFSLANSYSQLHMSQQQQQQSPYSMAPDMVPTPSHVMSNAPSPFSGQPGYQQQMIGPGPNGEKMMLAQNMPMARTTGTLGYGPQRGSNPGGPQQPTGAGVPYGTMISGPGVGMPGQQSQPQPPTPAAGRMAPNRTGVQSEMVTSRSLGPRSISGMSDPSGFQSASMYVSYPGPTSVSQPGPGMQGPAPPYSIAISNPGLSVSMSSTMVNSNSSNLAPPPGANYASGPTGLVGPSNGARSSGPMTAVYQSQPPRLPATGYTGIMGPAYAQAAPGPFRAQSGTAAAPPLSRSSGTSSPTQALIKDAAGPGTSGSPGPGVGKGPPPRPGTNPNAVMMQPGACLTPPAGAAAGALLISGGGPHAQSMLNPINGCLTLAQDGEVKLNSIQSSSASDACYMQTRPMSSSGSRDPTLSGMNGPLGSGAGDLILCSSSAAGSSATPLNAGFPMVSGGMSYAPGQQMTVIPNEFDTMGSTNSPLMMMTLPTSSPMPGVSAGPGVGAGGGLMNGGTMPMNVAMGSGAPAPPPYHHHHQQQQHHPQSGSMNSCRSVLGSGAGAPPSSFFTSPVSSGPAVTSCCNTGTVTSTTAMQQQQQHHHHAGMSQAMSDALMSTGPDRHFMGQLPGLDDGGQLTASGMVTSTGAPGLGGTNLSPAGKGPHPVSGAAGAGAPKSTARPKRTRTKNAAGTGRASKANAKKAAATAQVASIGPSSTTPDPYALNQRVHAQTAMRQKPPNWSMATTTTNNNGNNMCPSNFPSGMMSPTGLPIPGCEMRVGCVSPVPPQNGLLMRPSSGSNAATGVVTSFGNMPPTHGPPMLPVPSPGDPNAPRMSASPRQPPYGPGLQQMPVSQQQQQQQQQYFSSQAGGGPPVSSTGFYVTGPGNFTGNQQQPQSGQQMLRSPASGPQMSYANPVPQGPARPQPSPMHFQPHPMSQPTGPYPPLVSGMARTGAPASGPSVFGFSAGSAPATGSDGPVSAGGRLASPGPGTAFVPMASSTGDTDRLVCPITNGMVWGPTQIQLNDVLHQFLPDGVYVRRFEFDLTANHLQTIVGRTDLDIVVCSHLVSEPLQVCHWPSDAVQIRFNEYMLRLDRSSVQGGQSAHKVACVKQLCRPGRNQLEIAIVGLGEDPMQPSTLTKRRAASATLEMHRFAAFMAHMPALNVLLDGLQRRRPAGVSTLCEILESGRANGGSGSQRPTPVVAELSLICPVFRSRMRVPGRITGCEHIEAFDMEAFLRREVLWPRLNCPICGHKSPAGLDGLCIDTTILNALHLVHPSIDSILVRSDGFWRLPPPICLDLPSDVDQWQPLIGPLTEVATQAFQSMLRGSIVRAPQPPLHSYLSNSDASGPQSLSVDSASKSHLASQKLVPPGRSIKGNQSGTTAMAGQPSSGSQTPSNTPNKDLISSPPWPSSNQSQCATDQITGAINMDSGLCDSTASSRSQSASRPASQPMTWGHMQSPSAEPRSASASSTTTATTTTTVRTNSTPHPSTSPGCVALDPHNTHQYPLSDPAETSSMCDPRIGASTHPDGFAGAQVKPNPTPSECVAKVRRSSTGSAYPLGSGAPDHQLLIACDRVPPSSLPPLSEHMADLSEQSVSRSGWSDPTVSCGSGAVHSPCLSAPSTLPPTSLPASPALGPRPSSTNTTSFSIPAIPGVNMNVIERVSNSSPQCLSPSTTPDDGQVSSRTIVSSSNSDHAATNVSAESSEGLRVVTDVAVVGSPSANLPPVTADRATISGTYLSQQDDRPVRSAVTAKPSSEQATIVVAQPSEKKLPSSLNMGLDFLLAEDQTSTAAEMGNMDQASIVTQPLSDSATATTRPSSNELLSSGASSLKRTFSTHDQTDSDLASVESSETSGPASKSDNQTTSGSAQPDLVTGETGEAILKRIKLDPSMIPNTSDVGDCKPLWNNCVPEKPNLDGDDRGSCDGQQRRRLEEEQLTPISTKPPALSRLTDAPPTTDDDDDDGPGPTDLPLIPTELDEEYACGESIRTLSAQIDRLEVFLDESYVRFVESFSCT